jgi:hypothetical protein
VGKLLSGVVLHTPPFLVEIWLIRTDYRVCPDCDRLFRMKAPPSEMGTALFQASESMKFGLRG